MGKYSSILDKQPTASKYSALLDKFAKPEEEEEKSYIPPGAQMPPQSYITGSTGQAERLVPDQQRLLGATQALGLDRMAQEYGIIPEKFVDDQGLQAKANRFVGGAAAVTGATELGLGAASRAARLPAFLTPTAKNVMSDMYMAGGSGLGQAIGSEYGDKEALWGSVVGGFWYPALRAPAVGLTKRMFLGKGEEIDDFYNRVEQWRRVDAQPPSLGVVSPHVRSIEANLESVPGTYGPFHKAAKDAHELLARRAQELTRSVSGRADPYDAGRAIEGGLLGTRGNPGFIARFKARSSLLYDRLDAKLQNQSVDWAPFDAKIRSAKTPAPGYKGFYDELRTVGDEKLNRLLDEIQKGSQHKTGMGNIAVHPVPYQVVKDLRDGISRLLTDPDYIGNAGARGILKRARGIISEAMEDTALKAGAGREFYTANAYWERRIKTIDEFASVLARNDLTPERLYYWAVLDKNKGPSRLMRLRGSLTRDQFDVVRASLMKKMGLPDPDVIDNLGEGFNPIRFLRNVRSMDPKARRAVFGGVTVQLRGAKTNLEGALNELLDLSKQLEEAAGVFANPSGTAGRGLNAAILYSAAVAAGGAAVDAATGSTPGMAKGAFKSVLALAGGATISRKAVEKLFTNPGFITWLSEAMSLPAGRIPGHLARLTEIATDPETQVAVGEYLSVLDAINANMAQQNAPQRHRSPILGD